MPTLLQHAKNRLMPSGARPRRIQSGAFRGLTLDIDLAHNLQGYLGLAERELALPLQRLSQGIRTAIDVGAADGWYTTYFLARTRARVIAVEPHEPLAPAIRQNAAQSGADPSRLEILTACIGAQRPDRPDDNVLPLDALCADTEGPILVKLDVEGAELEVLASGPKLLARDDVRLIIETHSAWLEAECEHLLTWHGYTTHVIRNAWWRHIVPETRILPHNRWLVAHKRLTRP